MSEQCDCTAYCGDDPRIHRGEIQPCEDFKRCRRARCLEAAAPELLRIVKKLKAAMEAGLPHFNFPDEEARTFCVGFMAELDQAIQQAEGPL